MPRIDRIRPEFVEFMPETIEDGILYISEKYKVALHNCCCGCGEEVSTPLSATEYRLTKHGDAVSLHPSIGNHDFTCRSHYWIDRDSVRWSYAMTREQIEAGRAYDRQLKRGPPRAAPGLIGRVLGWLRRFVSIFRN